MDLGGDGFAVNELGGHRESSGDADILAARATLGLFYFCPFHFVLTVTDLTLQRGNRTLAKGVNLSLPAGQVLHLSGRNGTGKTTLLELLAGLREAEAGQITQRPLSSELHWVGHKNALNLNLTPQENLEFWCGLHAADASQIPAVLDRMGVKAQRHRPCRTLSAGQKRRTALARLLLVPRKLWLLDEPLDGLDAQGLSLFAELLNTHLDQSGAALITSHQAMPTAVTRVQAFVLP